MACGKIKVCGRFVRKYLPVLFIAYLALMVFLLFIMRLPARTYYLYECRTNGYWSTVMSKTNLVPFRTVSEFFHSTRSISLNDLGFVNNAGNVVMFVPFGVFLPMLFDRQRKLGTFMLTMLGVIVAVEIMQGLTLVGSCDIDDLILNLTGCALGYLVYTIVKRRSEHETDSGN